MSSPSPQKTTILAFISSLNSKDYASLGSLLSEDFTHRLFPSSLGGLGMPVRNKTQLLEWTGELDKIIKSFNMELAFELIESGDTVVAQTFSNGTTVQGHPYQNEWIMIFQFNQEGKIVGMREFVDSKYTLDAVAREMIVWPAADGL